MNYRKANRPTRTKYAVIVDGKTEMLYLESLTTYFKEELKCLSLKPDIPCNSTIAELAEKIVKYIEYDKIICIIDMDTKLRDNKERTEYNELKLKYKTESKIIFIETHPCTELWFLYYFQYTSKYFDLYEPELKKLIQKRIPNYEKKEPFCTHNYILKCGGNFDTAISNAKKSMETRNQDGRDYTYSQLFILFEEIGLVAKPQ